MSSEEDRRRSSVDSSDMEALQKGITTRVLADRLRTLSQSSDERSGISTPGQSKRGSDSERRRSSLDSTKARRPSKFLTGTSIPNSVIKSNLNAKEPAEKDPQTLRNERDARVSQILENVMPKQDKRLSYDESRDLEALAKIRKELQKRSSIIQANHTKHNTSKESEEETDDDASSPTSSSEETAKKQKRRASRRLESFLPLSGNRTPTFESVKKAVDNADLTTVLINADELAQQSTTRRDSAVQGGSSDALIQQPTSSFIRRRKFVSKLEKKKTGKAKDSSLEVLQPGINRPSVLLQKSGDFDEDEVTILKYPTRSNESSS